MAEASIRPVSHRLASWWPWVLGIFAGLALLWIADARWSLPLVAARADELLLFKHDRLIWGGWIVIACHGVGRLVCQVGRQGRVRRACVGLAWGGAWMTRGVVWYLLLCFGYETMRHLTDWAWKAPGAQTLIDFL